MFRGLSENKNSFHDSRASDTVSHELAPVVFRDKHMLSAIEKTNQYEPNSTIGLSADLDIHKKNAFSFMNENTDIHKMLRPNFEIYHQ